MQNQKKFATAARNGLPRMAFLVNSLLGLDWIETMRTSIISLILAGSFMGAAWADTLQLQDKAPDRYVVVKGDTLWDISGRFLKQPWRWPEIWKLNKQEIRDPHWIYPGDVVLLDRSGAEPRLRLLRDEKFRPGEGRLSPGVRTTPLDRDAIASISPSAIDPFLTRPLVLSPEAFAKAPRVAAAHESRVVFGMGDTIYAVNLDAKPGEVWQVFRSGKKLVDPDTKEVIGHEVTYLGEVRVEVAADVSTLRILSSKEEIGIGDRLVRAPEKTFINYSPRLPEQSVEGKIVSTYGSVADAGTFTTVVINRGAETGLEVGNVLFVYKKGIPVKREGDEPKRVTPPVKSANLFVYRVFPKLSYGLLLDATLPVNVGDGVKGRAAVKD